MSTSNTTNSKKNNEQLKPLDISEVGISSFSSRLTTLIGNDSVNAFALKCGVSEAAIRKYIKKESEPNLKTLVAIALACGVSVEWLAVGNEIPPTHVEANKKHSEGGNKLSNGLIEILGRLNEEEQEKIVRHIIDNGAKSLIPDELSQRAQAIAKLIISLNDEDQREILLLIESKKLGALIDNKSSRKTA